MPSFGVVLDACVIISASIRDTLLRAAEYRLYRAYWSEAILEEVHRNLIRDRLTDIHGADRLVRQLRAAFPGSPVDDYQSLVAIMPNNLKDRHVLAAAVRAGAQVIVTHNLADVPRPDLESFGIDLQTPDVFLTHLSTFAPRLLARIIVEQTADKRRRTSTVNETLNTLVKDAPEFSSRVRNLSGAILLQQPNDPGELSSAFGFFSSVEMAKAAAELRYGRDQRVSISQTAWQWRQHGELGASWEATVSESRFAIIPFPIG